LIDQAIMDMEEEYKQDLKLPSILLGKGFVDLASSKKETTTTTSAKESNSSGSSGNNSVVGVFGVGAEVSTPFGDGTIEVIGITVRIALIFLHLNSHNIIC
jgi:outer membrane protein assembly factor BamA